VTGVALDLADHHGAGPFLAHQGEVQDRVLSRLQAQHLGEAARVDGDGEGGPVQSVDDPRDLAGAAQPS
jgi:hypothetical protein